jgi:hypothetical protein
LVPYALNQGAKSSASGQEYNPAWKTAKFSLTLNTALSGTSPKGSAKKRLGSNPAGRTKKSRL